MARPLSKIQLEYKDLKLRVKNLGSNIKEILNVNERWLKGISNPLEGGKVKISVTNNSGWQLNTTLANYVAGYFEEWKKTGSGKGENEVWELDKAYFSLYKLNSYKQSLDEIIFLHCWESFKPDEAERGKNRKGYDKQVIQEKYQRSIHLHLKFLNLYDNNIEHKCLNKSHLAITLGRDTYEFNSIDNMDKAMKQAIKMVKEEVLDILSEN